MNYLIGLLFIRLRRFNISIFQQLLLNCWSLAVLLFVLLWFWENVCCWAVLICLLRIITWRIWSPLVNIFIVQIFIQSIDSMHALQCWHVVYTPGYLCASAGFGMNSSLLMKILLISILLLPNILKRKSLMRELMPLKTLWKMLLANWRIRCDVCWSLVEAVDSLYISLWQMKLILPTLKLFLPLRRRSRLMHDPWTRRCRWKRQLRSLISRPMHKLNWASKCIDVSLFATNQNPSLWFM